MVKLDESKYKGLFLKADDLTDEMILVKITRYSEIEVPNQEGLQSCIYVDAFTRPLNLNKTNIAVLVKEFGDETDVWRDKPIRLVKSMANNPQTHAQVETIRIKPYVKQPAKVK